VDDEGIKDNLLNRIDWDRVRKLPKEILQKYDGSRGFGRLPDLILADGGITQIRATKAAIRNIENEIGTTLNIAVYGMVKNDKHQTRALMDENRNEMEISEDLFNLITNFQNEVHNTAIGYHKMLRDKSMVKSELDNISGIGNVKKIELLKKFGSVENIAKASVDEIASVKGINKELAEKISKELAKKF
jgi:excinuclease ABC subunit C